MLDSSSVNGAGGGGAPSGARMKQQQQQHHLFHHHHHSHQPHGLGLEVMESPIGMSLHDSVVCFLSSFLLYISWLLLLSLSFVFPSSFFCVSIRINHSLIMVDSFLYFSKHAHFFPSVLMILLKVIPLSVWLKKYLLGNNQYSYVFTHFLLLLLNSPLTQQPAKLHTSIS